MKKLIAIILRCFGLRMGNHYYTTWHTGWNWRIFNLLYISFEIGALSSLKIHCFFYCYAANFTVKLPNPKSLKMYRFSSPFVQIYRGRDGINLKIYWFNEVKILEKDF